MPTHHKCKVCVSLVCPQCRSDRLFDELNNVRCKDCNQNPVENKILPWVFTTPNKSYMQFMWNTCVLLLLPYQRTVLKWSAVQGIPGRKNKCAICCTDVYIKKGYKFTETDSSSSSNSPPNDINYTSYTGTGEGGSCKWYIFSRHERREGR